ncbi:hypothetical protein MTO96_002744 [Rhipicephalus appendiculatus]
MHMPLVSCALVRVAALDLLTAFVTKYKPFLGLASYSGSKRTAFTTLSETVAAILGEVHRCLHLAIIAENNSAQIIQLLKCLAAVVTGSPYHRLQPGLLSRVISDVAVFMDNKDTQVQVAALTVLGAVVNVTPWPKEVAAALEQSSPPWSEKQRHREHEWRRQVSRLLLACCGLR